MRQDNAIILSSLILSRQHALIYPTVVTLLVLDAIALVARFYRYLSVRGDDSKITSKRAAVVQALALAIGSMLCR